MVRRSGRPSLIGTMARTAVVAGTAQAAAGSVAQRQHAAMAQQQAAAQAQVAAQAAPPVAAAAAPAGDDLVAQISALADLLASGVLTPEEFAAAKARLLS